MNISIKFVIVAIFLTSLDFRQPQAPSDEGAGADRRLKERKSKALMYLNPFSPSVSAAASVGASALQRCPPDTRTPYTGEANRLPSFR